MNEGIAGKLAKQFINSKITPLLMVAALLVGIMATFMTPREEEPQIVVPMVDLFIPFPGALPGKRVDNRSGHRPGGFAPAPWPPHPYWSPSNH